MRLYIDSIRQMENKITIEHWERNKAANMELIINNKMQIQMAESVIELCDEKIKELSNEQTNNNTANLE